MIRSSLLHLPLSFLILVFIYDDTMLSTLCQVLEEVQEFHQIETSLQIKQFLADTRVYLVKMMRTVNIKEAMMNTIAIVSDFRYVRRCSEMRDEMRDEIRDEMV
jgi:WASH complex subunit strumpellin